MSVITIDGHIGAGGPELGKRVARMLGQTHYADVSEVDYVVVVLE